MRRLASVLACVLFIASLLVGCTGAQPSPTLPAEGLSKPTATLPVEGKSAKPAQTGPAAPSPAPATPTAGVSVPASPAAEKQASSKQQTAVVKIGMLQSFVNGPIFIASAKGYFNEQGIDAQWTFFDSGSKVVPAIAAGQVDVGGGAISVGLFNAMGRDIRMKLVAGQSSNNPGFSGNGLVVRQDLIDSGQFKDYADFKGKRIALPVRPSASDIVLDRALKKANLTFKDVDIVEMPLPDTMAALANKSIDIALQNEPVRTLTQEQRIGKQFKGSEEIYPYQQFTAWVYSQQFIENNRDVGNRFMVALLKGSRDFDDAFIKKDPKARAEIIPLLIKNLPIKDPVMYDKMPAPWVEPDGSLNKKLVDDDQNWYIEHGYQKDKVDLDKAVDMYFVEYAVKQLGTYK